MVYENTNEATANIEKLRCEYLRLTNERLPMLAEQKGRAWPIKYDHCFQRVILDNVFGGVWNLYLQRPAYLNMDAVQIEKAISVAKGLINEQLDITLLNSKSLNWRKNKPQFELPL